MREFVLDAGLRLAGPAHDLVGANTVGAREDDRRPPSVFLRGVTVPGDRTPIRTSSVRQRPLAAVGVDNGRCRRRPRF